MARPNKVTAVDRESDIALMAHLMRRAGFGATYEELERRAAKGYQATVEELLHPDQQASLRLDLLQRYHIEWKDLNDIEVDQMYWTYRLINSPRPLEEKICLFWHGIFCVGQSKCEHGRQISLQLDKFRRHGLGRVNDLLIELARDPAMVYYLDNQMSHKGSVNENWGRELLELFSIGVGMDGIPNYSEDDVKEAARAFTGWTIGNAIPRYPYHRYEAIFLYNPDDHDQGLKTFLGETGPWNGEDIVDIICKQPAAARFIARHLYNFFVADEPPVPEWQRTPPRDAKTVKMLEDIYFRSGYDIRSMLRALFNSDAFKKARFARIKSPAEVVAATIRLAGGWEHPRPGLHPIAMSMRYMGQDLMNPPTVEGWHTGKQWIDSGTLVERVNFTADRVGDVSAPGVRAIVNRLNSNGKSVSPEYLVDRCLEMLGGYKLAEESRQEVVAHAADGGTLRPGDEAFAQRVGQVLQLIVSCPEYQFA